MEGICQVGAWWMARRLPRGRTMGYRCPPPLAGGGVAPGNADTRVITALLATATEEVVGGGALYTHLHLPSTLLPQRPVTPSA